MDNTHTHTDTCIERKCIIHTSSPHLTLFARFFACAATPARSYSTPDTCGKIYMSFFFFFCNFHHGSIIKRKKTDKPRGGRQQRRTSNRAVKSSGMQASEIWFLISIIFGTYFFCIIENGLCDIPRDITHHRSVFWALLWKAPSTATFQH